MTKRKLARGIVKGRHVLLALTVICAVLSVLSIGKTRINYDLSRYLSDNTMTKRALKIMEEEFGASQQLRVMFTDQPEEAVAEYAAAIRQLPGVLTATHDPEGGVREAEGKTCRLVSVTLRDGDAAETVRRLRGMFPEAGEVLVGGSAADQLDVQRRVGDEIPQVMIIAVAVVLAMLLLTSHAWLEPVILLIVLAVSILLNMGTNFIFPDVSFITFAVCAILQLALSIDYAIMLLHTFNGYRDSGLRAADAMTEALAECFMRVASSAFTTVAGLLSLLFMSFTIGFDIGLVLSKGILCSMICVFLLMPSVVLLLEKPLLRTRHRPLNPGGYHLAGAIDRVKKPLAAVMILAVLGGLYCSSRNTYSFANAESKADSASAKIEALFGASRPLAILVPGGEEDADYDLQRALVEKLQQIRRADGEPAVSAVTAMVTTGEAALRTYTPQEVAEMTGQSEAAIRLFFMLNGFGDAVRGDKLLEKAAAFAEGNGQIAALQEQLAVARSALIGPTKDRMLAELNFSATDPDMMQIMEQILTNAAEVYGEDVFITGNAMSTYDIANAFQSDLLKVNLITLLAILLIVTVSFRSFRLPLMLVFVIEGAIWITMGISRLIGEPIFFISYLICLSIQMGATIDYGILLCDQYRSQRRKGLPAREALCEAMRKALPTILTSGLIMTIAGFIIGERCSIYYISSIGLLVSRGALVSSVLVLSLLPALLLISDRRIIRDAGD
ncbi:MAG: MMPL family transporter [Clostridiales bacterium]|nr:MMPL family transporter [Clostridiales bacterium]